MTISLSIDGVIAELETLAQISAAEPPVVTRVVFSEADLRARAYVKSLCADAGLAISEDAVGNTFARWQGSEPDLAPIGTGSHIDAIPNAGLYDGCVGVLGGLEAIRVLKQLGFKPRRSIELVIFTAEEPTRFGIGCLGSRMMAGVMTPAQARTLRDQEGRDLDELRTSAGFTGTLESVALPAGRFEKFIELHIEHDENMTLKKAAQACNALVRAIQQKYPNADVSVHQDPAGLVEERLDEQIEARSAQK